MAFLSPAPVKWNAETAEVVRKVYQARNKSVYQVCYNRKAEKLSRVKQTNHVMAYFSSLYEPKTVPVLIPPECSTKVFGCHRASRYYMELTTYQDEISRYGYNRLKSAVSATAEQEGRKGVGDSMPSPAPANK